MEYNVHTLPNGIRLLHVPSASAISHACLLVKAGSRHEPEGKDGIAHFIEHLIFKRTKKRSTNQILNRLESVGADLNAYTTKEYTCIHASFLNPYLDRVLELFNDVVFHSTFPEEEIEKEKNIILDEIASYQDQPEEAIYDDFEDLVFSGHPLGHNILGSTETVAGFSREDVVEFIRSAYNTEETIIAVLGNYSLSKLINTGTRHFESVPKNKTAGSLGAPDIAAAVKLSAEKPIAQAHCILGTLTYSLHQEEKTGLLLLNNYLGGNGMSSVLNLVVREKHGIAYTIESGYSPLSDTGLFTVYFGTEKEKVSRALSLIFKEFKKLRDKPLSAVQLQKAKNKFIGQIALGEENRIGLIISMAKSLLDYEMIDSLETVFSKIQAVSADDLFKIAGETLDERKLSMLTFSPSY